MPRTTSAIQHHRARPGGYVTASHAHRRACPGGSTDWPATLAAASHLPPLAVRGFHSGYEKSLRRANNCPKTYIDLAAGTDLPLTIYH